MALIIGWWWWMLSVGQWYQITIMISKVTTSCWMIPGSVVVRDGGGWSKWMCPRAGGDREFASCGSWLQTHLAKQNRSLSLGVPIHLWWTPSLGYQQARQLWEGYVTGDYRNGGRLAAGQSRKETKHQIDGPNVQPQPTSPGVAAAEPASLCGR